MKRRMTAKAAALAAAAGITLAAALAAPGTARASTDPSWNLALQSRDSGLFASIAAISKTNVWAVGDLWQGSKTVYKPYIERFNGSRWTSVTIPGARMTSGTVQATSASDVWVFGLTPNAQNVSASGAYRWDGKRWHKIPVPALTYLQGTVVLGPSNVWAFGGSGTVPGDVFHWNGKTWKAYDLDATPFIPQYISASSAGNIWLAGMTWTSRTVEKASAYRWNGSRWLAVSTPHPVIDVGPGVTALSPSNVWIGWNTQTQELAAHWNGRRWQQITAPGDVEANTLDIVPDGRGGEWFGPFADWTGHAWISALGVSPAYSGGGFGDIVRIPGTLSFLMAAGVENQGSSVEHPTIYRLSLG